MGFHGRVGLGVALGALIAGCSLFADLDDLSQRTIIVQPEVGTAETGSQLPGPTTDGGDGADEGPALPLSCEGENEFCESFNDDAFLGRFDDVQDEDGTVDYHTAAPYSPPGAAYIALPSAGADFNGVLLDKFFQSVPRIVTVDLRIQLQNREPSAGLGFLSITVENPGDPDSRLELATLMDPNKLNIVESGESIEPAGHDWSFDWNQGTWYLVTVVLNTATKHAEGWVDGVQLLDFSLNGQWAVRDNLDVSIGMWGRTGASNAAFVVDDLKIKVEP